MVSISNPGAKVPGNMANVEQSALKAATVVHSMTPTLDDSIATTQTLPFKDATISIAYAVDNATVEVATTVAPPAALAIIPKQETSPDHPSERMLKPGRQQPSSPLRLLHYPFVQTHRLLFYLTSKPRHGHSLVRITTAKGSKRHKALSPFSNQPWLLYIISPGAS
jgi:hypothetical protein